jgi:arylsulfatase A-like enzyme
MSVRMLLCRVVFALTAASFLFPVGVAVAADSSVGQPNIVMLNIDDHGVSNDVVWSRMSTINQLFIQHGLSFENYWNNYPLCCPGRATQLTGQEAHHHGVVNNDGLLFDPSDTLATELHDQGYYTFISGKYLNGTRRLPDKTPPGWDQVAIFGGGYYLYDSWVNDGLVPHGVAVDDYSTDVFANHSIDFLRAAPADQPVFAYLNPYAVHLGSDQNGVRVGTEPAPAVRHTGDPRCADAPPFAPASFNEADVSDKPAYIQRIKPFTTTGFPMVRVCESLLAVDEWLARVVEELSDQDRLDNTVFVLTSDNARSWGANRWLKKIAPYAAEDPLYVAWPGVISGNHRLDTSLLSNVDLAPTLCELGGCEMGPFANGRPVDGMSFAGLLAPDSYSSVPARRGIILEHRGPKSQVPRWRGIITSPTGRYGQRFLIEYDEIHDRELYDLSGGPCIKWQVGDPGDPCMMSNVGYDPTKQVLRKNLHQLLLTLW